MGASRPREKSAIEDAGSVRRLRVRNRRALTRLAVEVPAIVAWQDQEQSGLVTDLAHGGAFVECDDKPSVATPVRVSVSVNQKLVVLRGVVRWIGERGVGIQFGDMGPADSDAVSALFGLPHPTR